MWAVLPAAGAGTRMGEVAGDRPKPLLSLGDETLMGRILRDVSPAVEAICLVVAPGASAVREAVGSRIRGVPVRYAVQEERRGVGDAICAAAPVVDGPLAVIMADAFFREPLAPCLDAWREEGTPGAVLVQPVDGPVDEPTGLVRVSDGRVMSLEKGTDSRGYTHRVCGAFMFPPSVFDVCREVAVSPTGEVEAEALVRALLAGGIPFAALPYDGWRRNVNTPADLEEVRRRVASAGS